MPLCSVYSSAATSDDSLKVFDFAKAASSQWVRLWSKLREKEREREDDLFESRTAVHRC